MSGLYVHIPFCKRKCNYCGFYSVELKAEDLDAFLRAIKKEAEIKRCTYPLPRSFKTVYIGGGTPSVISLKLLELIDFLTDFFLIEKDAEFTVELNPESTTRELLEGLLASGVNRLSFGVQTLDDRDLLMLGRLHSSKEALSAIEMALSLGFTNLSVDLIYGYPGHEIETWEMTLRQLLKFPINHVSCYEFELESGSRIEKQINDGILKLIMEDISLKLMDLRDEILSMYGFKQYEISNFSKVGYECLHNINYWRNGEYLGLGPSSATHLSGVREKNISDLRTYVEGTEKNEIIVEYRETLKDIMKFKESIMLSLRMVEGVKVERFLEEYRINPIEFYKEELKFLHSNSLIELNEKGFSLTKKGFRLANYVMQKLL